ncbi:MAG TPA: hypothetical protein PLP64_01780 [Pseudothermotoga sp.]|nr:hypothetical protein [Pseudothermotoga sp.]HOK82941.1 hypothetical protein [Pseudothermotoga sp.]HPP69885.1 hypothetical protein [Pseudothermotoga sp.]
MKWYWLWGIIFIVLGIWTLIPVSTASKPCLVGYYAHCTFTPVSTVMCFALSGLFYWLGRRKVKHTTK